MDFKNSGFVEFSRPFGSRKPKGVIICGLPRSGTTAVAKCLQNAGFSLGKDLSNVLEDQEFRSCLTPFSNNGLAAYINSRSESAGYFPWAAKYPESYLEIPNLMSFQDMAIVVVTRDPLAMAKRNNISVFQEIDFFY